jgi:DNA polymerase-1
LSTRHLLIDADVLIYECASSNEVATDWGDGYWTWHCDENAVKEAVLASLYRLQNEFGADRYTLCLTDSDGNFRKRILPSYKGNRSNVKKPLVLRSIKQWLIDELNAYLRPGLEGDDCLGILSTMKHKDKDERIIVSIDKDMKTIPGLYSRGTKADIRRISEYEADYWHMFQTLTGDSTDGYSGCPGIGPVKAEKILETTAPEYAGDAYVPYLWSQVVAAYEAKGLTEDDALIQARVARILRASDYDFKKKEPILWQP